MKRVFLSFFLFLVVVFLAVQFAMSPVLDRLAQSRIAKRMEKHSIDIAKGPLFLLEEYFRGIPEKDFASRMESLSTRFGFNVAIKPVKNLDLPVPDVEALSRGEIIVKDKWQTFYRMMPGTDYSFILGPVKDLEETTDVSDIHILGLSMLLFFMVFLSLIWVFPLWTNLKRIMDAADRFGNGDTSVRVKLINGSALRPLADNFNSMAERISALLWSRKMLVNAVSHEFRTPVARIRFGLEMLESAVKAEDRKRHLEGILSDMEELDDLVTELAVYSRLDSAVPELCVETIPVREWLESIFRASACPGLKIKHEIQEKAFCGSAMCKTIDADPRYMGRAVGNLVTNAARHAKSRISACVSSKDGYTEITIDDDGQGIAAEDMKRVFEPFVRLDESRNRDSGGHGLGLAIVRQIMIWHDGTVTVARSPLGGASFRLRWPG